VLALMSLSLDQYLATGEVAGPRQVLLTGRYACYDVYECKDGGWISVGAIEPHFYRNLCERLGCPEHAGSQMDDAKQGDVRAAFAAAFKTRTRDEWTDELAPNDTCVAPVLSIPEVTRHPHLRARGTFMQARHPEEGAFEQTAPVLAGGLRAQPETVVRPPFETDTERVLAEAGLEPARIASLLESGIVE
jgi:alpha-methylacyl-CoA racemase